MSHPPGAILIPTGTLSRYAAFWGSVVSLETPKGSRVYTAIGSSITENLRNGIRQIQEAEKNSKDGWKAAWVWRLDDDHIFDRDTLLRLLAHDKDIVTPLNIHRIFPHNPVLNPTKIREMVFEVVDWDWLKGKSGLLEVAAIGGAGVLIKRHVLDAIPDPVFEDWKGTPEDPRYSPNEDLHFSKKAAERGFKMYVDLDTTMAHITPVALRPFRNPDGEWDISYEGA